MLRLEIAQIQGGFINVAHKHNYTVTLAEYPRAQKHKREGFAAEHLFRMFYIWLVLSLM